MDRIFGRRPDTRWGRLHTFKGVFMMVSSFSGWHLPVYCILALLLLFSACRKDETLPARIQQASRTYKKSGDYESLKTLAAYLHQGMPEPDVKQLLGEPDYSPIDGQYYYGSDSADAEPHFVLGLVINYTRQDSTKPNSPRILGTFELMPIGE